MIDLALLEPEIPANAGNVARLCAATGVPLHLIGRLGFSFRHPAARRAAMDYWEQVEVHRHVDHQAFREATAGRTVWMFSTHGERAHWDVRFGVGDVLLFGPESRGLPDALLTADPARVVRIPMREGARSLNLASAAAIGVFEALRQLRARSAAPTGGTDLSENPTPERARLR